MDVLTQVAAATRGLQAVALELRDSYLRHCVSEAAAAGGDIAEERLGEASATLPAW